MYVLVKFRNRRHSAVPIIWLIIGENGTLKCWWPRYGLTFKLKNVVPPPLLIDLKEVKKWQVLDCEYVMNAS